MNVTQDRHIIKKPYLLKQYKIHKQHTIVKQHIEPSQRCFSDECRYEAWRHYFAGKSWREIARLVNKRFHASHHRCPNGPHTAQWAMHSVIEMGRRICDEVDVGGVEIARARFLSQLFSHRQFGIYLSEDSEIPPSVRLSAREFVLHVDEIIATLCGLSTRKATLLIGQDPNASPVKALIMALTPQDIGRALMELEADGGLQDARIVDVQSDATGTS